jgi:hypothetical protein
MNKLKTNDHLPQNAVSDSLLLLNLEDWHYFNVEINGRGHIRNRYLSKWRKVRRTICDTAKMP